MATINSARSNYRDVVAVPEAVTGRLIVLGNVEVYALKPGGDPATVGDRVNVFGSRNANDLAPLAQPMVTNATGIIDFWAEPGEYDIFIHDRTAPARVGDQRFGWSSLSPIDKGIPAAKIRDDNGLDLAALSAAIMRQVSPLGTVIDWWRPSSTYDAGAGPGNPPPGYEICDGRVVAANANDITPGQALTLPDLRNKFIIGADIIKADGAASSNGDGTAAYNAQHPNAPGIRGTGGSNTSKNLEHQHDITHSHGVAGVDHLHSAGSYYAGSHAHHLEFNSGVANRGGTWNPAKQDGSQEPWAYSNHLHSINGDTWGQSAGLGGSSGAADRSLATSTNSISATLSGKELGTAIDMRPQHYGLLKIMKVRRA